jgi:hypothetical protein
VRLSIANTLEQNEDGSGTLDAKDEGILDLMIAKSWAIRLATEAARTVLSVDQIIVARQAGGPKPPGPNPVSHAFQSCLMNETNQLRIGTKIRYTTIRGAVKMYNYQSLYTPFASCFPM